MRLLSTVGQGSFGTVYKAIWRGSLVAAKVVDGGQECHRIISEVEKSK